MAEHWTDVAERFSRQAWAVENLQFLIVLGSSMKKIGTYLESFGAEAAPIGSGVEFKAFLPAFEQTVLTPLADLFAAMAPAARAVAEAPSAPIT